MHDFTKCYLLVVVRVHNLKEVFNFSIRITKTHHLNQACELMLIQDPVAVGVDRFENLSKFFKEFLMFVKLKV